VKANVREMFFIDSKTHEYAAAQYREHVAGQAILIKSEVSSYFANIFFKLTGQRCQQNFLQMKMSDLFTHL
jgi:hypothetical protein